jgi:hypothetical protein
LARRKAIDEDARARHPERWSGATRNWRKVEVVCLTRTTQSRHKQRKWRRLQHEKYDNYLDKHRTFMTMIYMIASPAGFILKST